MVFEGKEFGLGAMIGFGVATLMWVMFIVALYAPIENTNAATFSIANGTGEDLNITVFVLDGNDWDEIAVSIAANDTIPLAITWHGDGGVNVHIVYHDWDDNERILRYYVRDGEYQVAMLV